MFSIRASDVVCTIVDKLLPRDGKSVVEFVNNRSVRCENGMLFRLDCQLGNYVSTASSFSRRQRVCFLICGNRHVWVAIEPNEERWHSVIKIPLAAWENTSNHDVGWRTDGIDSPLTKLYFDYANDINVMRRENKLEPIAPADMSEHVHLDMWQNVLVKHASIPNHYNGREVMSVENGPE